MGRSARQGRALDGELPCDLFATLYDISTPLFHLPNPRTSFAPRGERSDVGAFRDSSDRMIRRGVSTIISTGWLLVRLCTERSRRMRLSKMVVLKVRWSRFLEKIKDTISARSATEVRSGVD